MLSTYESSIKEIPYSQEKVYAKLSDLNHLEGIKDKIPADKVKDLTFDTDTVNCTISPVGNVSLRIIEREPPKCIKFETVSSPVPFNLWIQIVPIGEERCKIRLTVKAELNPFIKGMVEKPLKEMLEKMVEALANLSYE